MMNQSVTCRKDYFASGMVLMLFVQIERETREWSFRWRNKTITRLSTTNRGGMENGL